MIAPLLHRIPAQCEQRWPTVDAVVGGVEVGGEVLGTGLRLDAST